MKNIIKYLRGVLYDNAWIIGGFLLLLWAVIVNVFPVGYIIAGGDVVQDINLAQNFTTMWYQWLGRGSLFNLPIYILDVLGVSDSAQLSAYLAGFLFAAYGSFLIFVRTVLPKVHQYIAVLGALFYATNIYTLYIFTSTWGFTSYQVLYVFIPALTAFFILSLTKKESILPMFYFLFTMALASMSFSNPAFALSLTIYFALLAILLVVFRIVGVNGRFWKVGGVMVVGAVLLNAYWILPTSLSVKSGVAEVAVSQDIVLGDALSKTANKISDTVRLMPTHEQSSFYPTNFPYPSQAWAKPIILVLAFVPFLLILMGLFFTKSNSRSSSLYIVFFVLFIFFIVLVARVRFPFDAFSAIVFQLPGFNVLRGWDKMAIFTPFILVLLVTIALGTLSNMVNKKWRRVVGGSFFLLIIILALPFYAGGIQTKLSYSLKNNKAKDFRKANYSALVKIPEDYYAIGDIINAQDDDFKISILPFVPGSSVGKVKLNDLKMNAPHIARKLYNKKYIEPNEKYIGNWLFVKEYNEQYYNPQWIVDLYGFLGIKYIIYQNDIGDALFAKMEQSRKHLESVGVLEVVAEQSSFTLYRIEPKYVVPYIYTSNAKNGYVAPTVDGLSDRLATLRAQINKAKYQKQNPREFVVAQNSLQNQSRIYLNDKYDALWRAHYTTCDGAQKTLVRDEQVRYANAWKLEGQKICGDLRIIYRPLEFLRIGLIISIMTLMSVIVAFVVVKRKFYE